MAQIKCNGKLVTLSRQLVQEPSECPVCGEPTSRNQSQSGEGALTVCTNLDCEAKVVGKIKRWIKSLNILGVGDSVLEALVNQAGVENVADLYRLTRAELAEMLISDSNRFGDSRAESLLKEIDNARCMTIDQFMGSLGFQFLGKRRVKLVREKVPGELDRVEDWLDGKMRKLDVGLPNVVDKIQDEIDSKAGLINELLKHVRVEEEKETQVDNNSDTMSFCLTGKMSKQRGEIEGDIMAAGHVAHSRMVKDTRFLVAADPDSGSSKLRKAEKNGTKVISEEKLYELLGV